MNYKVMQRPMFRLGGSARKNYRTGTDLSDIEKTINELGSVRDKYLRTQRAVLPFQALSGQMDNIRSIRSLGDITDILSNLGQSQELFGALGKLPAIELKQKKGELEDKLSILKAKKDASGSSTRLKSELAIRRIKTNIENLTKQKRALENKEGPEVANKIAEIDSKIDKEKSALNAYYRDNLRFQALQYLKDDAVVGQKITEEEIQDAMKLIRGYSTGGRVGYQQGTPNPMVMPQPKPQEAVQDRQLDTLMDAAPALEDPNQAKSMGEKDMYNALRRRLPKEISDDVVRLIAYNQEAFADFANISDQSDVESFNQKYNVELVLPVGNQ